MSQPPAKRVRLNEPENEPISETQGPLNEIQERQDETSQSPNEMAELEAPSDAEPYFYWSNATTVLPELPVEVIMMLAERLLFVTWEEWDGSSTEEAEYHENPRPTLSIICSNQPDTEPKLRYNFNLELFQVNQLWRDACFEYLRTKDFLFQIRPDWSYGFRADDPTRPDDHFERSLGWERDYVMSFQWRNAVRYLQVKIPPVAKDRARPTRPTDSLLTPQAFPKLKAIFLDSRSLPCVGSCLRANPSAAFNTLEFSWKSAYHLNPLGSVTLRERCPKLCYDARTRIRTCPEPGPDVYIHCNVNFDDMEEEERAKMPRLDDPDVVLFRVTTKQGPRGHLRFQYDWYGSNTSMRQLANQDENWKVFREVSRFAEDEVDYVYRVDWAYQDKHRRDEYNSDTSVAMVFGWYMTYMEYGKYGKWNAPNDFRWYGDARNVDFDRVMNDEDITFLQEFKDNEDLRFHAEKIHNDGDSDRSDLEGSEDEAPDDADGDDAEGAD